MTVGDTCFAEGMTAYRKGLDGSASPYRGVEAWAGHESLWDDGFFAAMVEDGSYVPIDPMPGDTDAR